MLLNTFAIFVCFQLIDALTDVKPCKPAPGQTVVPAEVQFHDCTTQPCLAPRGMNLTVDVTFVAEDNFDTVVTNMFATVAGMKHGYPGIDNTDACKLLYSMPDKAPVGCPIEKGKSYLYTLFLPIKSSFPKITAPIHVGLKDKSSARTAACFEFTMKVV